MISRILLPYSTTLWICHRKKALILICKFSYKKISLKLWNFLWITMKFANLSKYKVIQWWWNHMTYILPILGFFRLKTSTLKYLRLLQREFSTILVYIDITGKTKKLCTLTVYCLFFHKKIYNSRKSYSLIFINWCWITTLPKNAMFSVPRLT